MEGAPSFSSIAIRSRSVRNDGGEGGGLDLVPSLRARLFYRPAELRGSAR